MAPRERSETRSAPGQGAEHRNGTDGPRIFVSIAAYRDPDLLPTIEDCLAKARWPERLRFGVCWQHGPEEVPLERFSDPSFRVLDVDWRESRGACWARAEIMKLWDHEEWFLQLDAHHRFVRDWDAKLLDQAAATGSPKPILTTYVGPFVPGDADSFTPEPMRMEFDYFTGEGIVLFRPGPIPDWQTSSAPRRSRFLSAHFLFAPGSLVAEVPYDPGLYFIGEEITLAVRAYTHGYDLFHPGEIVVWHEYTRNYRRKHWDDHTAANGAAIEWSQRDAPSRETAGRLLTEPHTGPFGCGDVRSVADYEAYAGISFAHRRVQDYTRKHLEPPNPPLAGDWAARTRDHTVQITITGEQIPSPPSEDTDWWYVGVHDRDRSELFRADADHEEIEGLCAGDPASITIVREFESTASPAGWTVWPYSASNGWGDAIEGELVGDGSGQWRTAAAVQDGADLLRCYPRAAPGLDWTETDGGFRVTRDGHVNGLVVNPTGVFVLELANGRYSLAEIVDIVADAFGLADQPQAEIATFLDSASRRGLVELHGTERAAR